MPFCYLVPVTLFVASGEREEDDYYDLCVKRGFKGGRITSYRSTNWWLGFEPSQANKTKQNKTTTSLSLCSLHTPAIFIRRLPHVRNSTMIDAEIYQLFIYSFSPISNFFLFFQIKKSSWCWQVDNSLTFNIF